MHTPVCQSSDLVDGTYSVRLDGSGRGKPGGDKAATQAQAAAVVDGASIHRPALAGQRHSNLSGNT